MLATASCFYYPFITLLTFFNQSTPYQTNHHLSFVDSYHQTNNSYSISLELRRMINSHPSHCLNMSPILRSHHPPKPTVFLSNKEPPLQGIKMSVLPYWRGNSWSDSNETIRSSDEEMNQNFTGIFPPPLAKSRAKRDPIILVDTEVIEDSREFWQNCLIGMIMDFRRFSVRSVQRIINNAWRLRDRVTVVGRSNHNYVIHVNDSKDQVFIWQHRPWSID